MPESGSIPSIHIHCAGRTDVGRVRKQNEDSILVRPDLGLFVVADGMGGHQAGDVASRIAVETLTDFFEETLVEPVPPVPPNYADLEVGAQRLLMGILQANNNVLSASKATATRNGMGSTIASIHVCPDGTVHIGHLGDSRVYRISGGEIEQTTQDHSFVNQVRWRAPDVDQAVLDALPKNVITCALGMQEDPEVELRTELSLSGDMYLICSDGLSGFLTSEQMLQALEICSTLDEACELLVAAANDAGGKDNISVIVVRVDRPYELDDDDRSEDTLVEKQASVVTGACPECGFVRIGDSLFCVECGCRFPD